jgi:hypothetical protein
MVFVHQFTGEIRREVATEPRNKRARLSRLPLHPTSQLKSPRPSISAPPNWPAESCQQEHQPFHGKVRNPQVRRSSQDTSGAAADGAGVRGHTSSQLEHAATASPRTARGGRPSVAWRCTERPGRALGPWPGRRRGEVEQAKRRTEATSPSLTVRSSGGVEAPNGSGGSLPLVYCTLYERFTYIPLCRHDPFASAECIVAAHTSFRVSFMNHDA